MSARNSRRLTVRQGSQKVSIIPDLRRKSVVPGQNRKPSTIPFGFENVLGGVDAEAEHIRHLTDDSDSDSEQEYNQGYFVKKKKKQRGSWIAENFTKKDCVKYTLNPNAAKKGCYCGRTKRQHNRDAQQAETAHDSERDSRTPMKDLIMECPTDAYGEIQFGQAEGVNNSAKYVRFSDTTDSTTILELLMYYWNLPKPRLVLSIIGGGRSFKLNKQDQDTFSRGILKAAQTTDAWILTTGFNAGVPKIVGQTMKESQTLKWLSQGADAEDQGLNCIGIAPWGYVSGSDQLVGKNGKGCYPARYKLSNVIVKNRPVPLNPNHTHFLFVDNGMRNEPAYGGEIMMRSQIEGAIQAPTSVNGLGLPVVLLVLEGGVDTILNVKSSISQGIPTVVCDGTGRAADILAYAHHNSKECEDGVRRVKEANIPFLEEKLRISFGLQPGTDVMNKMLHNINFCVQDKQLITVFEMAEGENTDLDLAILTALLQGQATTKFYQLALALSWNRVDVAHEYICTDEVTWPSGSLDNFLTQAITDNQVGFVDLFLEQGIVMKDYLTVSKLRGLYNTCEMDQHFRKLLVNIRGGRLYDSIYLNDVRLVLQKLLGNLEDNLYTFDRRHTCHNRETLAFAILSTTLTGVDLVQKSYQEYLRSERKKVTTGSSSLTMAELANPGMHFARPFSELFLWAVLTNRIKLAEFFWQQTENPIVAAIMSSCVLKKVADRVAEPHEKAEHQENAKKFEELATAVLDKCYKTDSTLAQMMLDAPNDHIGKKTVLSMAAEAEDKKFISHPCCQTLLNNIWKSGIRSGNWKILVGILCPIFILTNVGFFPAEDGFELRPLKKLKVFYTAPVARFWSGTISYVCLVLLYSYVILANFGSGPTIVELVLALWICVLLIDELKQALLGGEEDDTIKQRIKTWMSSEWNILDGIFLLCSSIGIILHYVGHMKLSQGFYAMGCFLLYTRSLRTSAISPYLGPLLVMIRKMIIEMLGFLFILCVFLLGYGVAGEALARPHSDFGGHTIVNVLYQPYFTIYGELFLDGTHPDCGLPDDPCPESHPLLPVMLALYLLLGNVLLLNLLIAIFSAVFEEVQENSVEIWKFELYHLVMESSELPLVPAPFVIFEHFYHLFAWLLKKCRRSCCKGKKQKVKAKYSKKQKRMLKMFETECAADFRKKRAEQERDEIPERIKRVDKQLENLNKQYETMSMEITKQLQDLKKTISAGCCHTPDLLADSQGQMMTSQGQMVNLQGQMMNSQGHRMNSQGQCVNSQGHTVISQGQMVTPQAQMVTSQKQMVNLKGQISQGQLITSTGRSSEPSIVEVKDPDTVSQTSIASSTSSSSQGKKKKGKSGKRTAKVAPHTTLTEKSTKWANTQPGAPISNSATVHETPGPSGQVHDLGQRASSNDLSREGSFKPKKSSISADQFMHMNALLCDIPQDTNTPINTKTETLSNQTNIASGPAAPISFGDGSAHSSFTKGAAIHGSSGSDAAAANPFSVVNVGVASPQVKILNPTSQPSTSVSATGMIAASPDVVQNSSMGSPNVPAGPKHENFTLPSGERSETFSLEQNKLHMNFSTEHLMDEDQNTGHKDNTLPRIRDDPEGEEVAAVSDAAHKSDENALNSDAQVKVSDIAPKSDENAPNSSSDSSEGAKNSVDNLSEDASPVVGQVETTDDTKAFVQSKKRRRRPKRMAMSVDEFLNSDPL